MPVRLRIILRIWVVTQCDASRASVGAVLRQDRPIAFHSQALKGKNLLMSTYEKEMLALVIAVRKWKHYLLGRKFIVRTDQKSLQYLWSQKIATEAQQKWLYKLMGLDFSIEYKKGSENKVVALYLGRDEVLKGLKDNIKLAQNKMKKRYDLKHRDKVFEVGSWVYVQLQPYRQISVSLRQNAKLAPRYYGPFRILECIGQVAYKLELPATSRIHPVFHVSKLKEKLGARISSQPQLPITIGEQEELGARLLAILDRQVRRNKTEVLIHWQGLPTSDATWEDLEAMKIQFPQYTLEDKGLFKKGGV
uniref:Chromo domain-containing protein n=1 Tax=Fagus sylvatica TaxID=28930 RepID=A0A2N9IRD5_FAGSY